jgi:hypothetical protein
MHLPASAMQLDHQAGLDGCGTAEVMRRMLRVVVVSVTVWRESGQMKGLAGRFSSPSIV